jgi:uncharacterized protein YecT (DUF1311 family)
MKKNLFILLMTVGLLAAGCGKTEKEEIQMTPEVESNEIVEDTAEENTPQVEADTEKETEKEVQNLAFEDLEDYQFYFASGAGGWRTFLNIDADGKFDGAYSDSEMGAVGEDYPNGTYYLCEFIGKFSNLTQVNDYTYSVKIADLRCAKEPETTEIIDEILYHYSTPFGIEGTEEILIYLPGAPIAELPEQYMNWVRNAMIEPDTSSLPFYGLYNTTEQNGFSSYEISLDEQLASIREQADAVSAALQNDPLTQAEMNLKSQELYELWDCALDAVLYALESTLPEEELAALTEEQQAWIAGKDAAVKEAGQAVQGGSIYPLIVHGEAARLTEERVLELYERLK